MEPNSHPRPSHKLLRSFTLLAVMAMVASLLAATAAPAAAQTAGPVKVLGVENFYADIASQVGGTKVQVGTILSDPSVDPHLYESNVDDAKLIANADIVIKNSVGYDTFIDKLLAASPRQGRILIDVAQLTGHVDGDNPHLWYDTFNTMPILIPALTQALSQKDPADQAYFTAQGQAFLASLQPIQELVTTIKTKYAGAPVMASEPLWNYQAKAAGLNMLYAEGAFQKATQEANDPPAAAVVEYRNAINNRVAKMFMFNNQAVTQMSQQLSDYAAASNIPVVSMSETMPPNTTYQQWMISQLTAALQALGG